MSANTQFSVQKGFVAEVLTKGTTPHWEILRDGNGEGIYSEVAHGNGPMVDLIFRLREIASQSALNSAKIQAGE